MKRPFEINTLKEFLDLKTDQYNNPSFILTDPISVPRLFETREDIEIAGFLTATISWGRRESILGNARHLLGLMKGSPYSFVMDSAERDLSNLENFIHRTFNGTDCIYFIKALKEIYTRFDNMENAFLHGFDGHHIMTAITGFRRLFFSLEHAHRTEKHLADPSKGASAKRINMFLRWMVRKDDRGVDLGLWENFSPSLLMCPLDVHSGSVARKLGLLERKQNDWKAVEELTGKLREYDPEDPVKYDYALFGLGVFENF